MLKLEYQTGKQVFTPGDETGTNELRRTRENAMSRNDHFLFREERVPVPVLYSAGGIDLVGFL